ncbi:MAG TPA: hypothetical protein PKD09_20755 [Aggregatilinea sp.]|jgi:hypothetical protein|uniref:hypothetical protein n=1 Tax=Aggregatilinea sp. TaxID=2806333 RepID=UPI002BAD2D61|nr:hypothetical protein [Aggregatilinea sp.]HML24099.1 hypothetical protein [Aggregatilinea sp.]
MLVFNRFKSLAGLAAVLVIVASGCGALPGNTEVSDLETRNAQLQGTIDGLGTPAATIAALAMTADRGMMMQAELSNVQGTALAAQATLTVQQYGGATNPNVSVPQTPNNPNGAVPMTPATPGDGSGGGTGGTISTNGTEFYETTISAARDAYDCPLNPTTVFDIADPVVYAIVRVRNLQAGSTISARWSANGALYEESDCWTPTENWDDVCAYCDLSPKDVTFESGTWSVEMLLDNERLSQATFQIVDNSGTTGDTTGDTTDDTTTDGTTN